jgi:hydroxymethylpyrimidine kinase / phosphomethylpyrimidine kinase / thiamine-phosphate diphosphorylase
VAYLLTIAGHDPIHGAGVTADLATWAAMGWDGASVVTTLTVQNSHGLIELAPVSPALLQASLQAVLADGEPAAIKIGMLGDSALADTLIPFLAERTCPVVLDPVLTGSNGTLALTATGSRDDPLASLRALMRSAHVITPNLPEAQTLLGQREPSLHDLRQLCRSAAILKGGHAPGPDSIDQVINAQRSASLFNSRWPGGSVHGTGCVFSAALTAGLAQGWDVFDAATLAKLRVHAGIAQARPRPGRSQVQTAAQLSSAHLPSLRWSHSPACASALPFAPLIGRLGFYPVVPSAEWVERLLAWGVRTVQLRIKNGDMSGAALHQEIARAVHAGARYPGAQVFINDHWQSALALGAYGVHLGQEDLALADLPALQAAGLRLGLSSHTPAEMAAAHAVEPSYVALGPVYPTTLKAMHYASLGLTQLRDWTRLYQPRYPVVAIGGISLARAPGVIACGVDGLAVVSAVTQAPDPHQAVLAFQSVCNQAVPAPIAVV